MSDPEYATIVITIRQGTRTQVLTANRVKLWSFDTTSPDGVVSMEDPPDVRATGQPVCTLTFEPLPDDKETIYTVAVINQGVLT